MMMQQVQERVHSPKDPSQGLVRDVRGQARLNAE
jgi:hypothetical protein